MCGADVRVSGGWGGKCPSVVNDRAYGRRSERDFNVTSRPHAAAPCTARTVRGHAQRPATDFIATPASSDYRRHSLLQSSSHLPYGRPRC